MWVFSRHGFYSVVAALNEDRTIDPTRVTVRARLRKHLTELIKVHRGLLRGATKIITNIESDYRYRIVIGKDMWKDVAAAIASDINYDNFKATINDPTYSKWLAKVWTVGYGIQTEDEVNTPVKEY